MSRLSLAFAAAVAVVALVVLAGSGRPAYLLGRAVGLAAFAALAWFSWSAASGLVARWRRAAMVNEE